jgi:hypothetical protein
LKCVLGVRHVSEYTLTDVENHRAVATNKSREGCLVAAGEEFLEKLAVVSAV